MGNREDLLAGAKRCLYEKGYTRTTARDIAAASGVSLAAIGYHFRSKEALMNTALFQAMQEWGDEIERALTADADPGATPAERFAATWDRVIASFATHRPVWVTQFELIAQIDRLPEIREQLVASMDAARLGLAEMFRNVGAPAGEAGGDKDARIVGSLYQAMLSGVLVQWLVDPEQAPSGRDLVDALRIVGDDMGTASTAREA
ncbi:MULTISPECIES: TetR/AcrR family transcriptional regulator [Streptosporangium]|uniref:AcrR family transcriptional regulator n=1 Tax=Streptosporangium brasiliense TaxID=47480 RepID=A0ABT9R170_9ACTN|nr:TetR/AcrR family transcriptional regulator [Streptosporangium brasiliense]MDP9862641.1 AcrR family transcriptional regulator [Streptosporangium brasiliense]